MSVPIPDLDDKAFEELVDEAKRLLPVYAKEWTDHNLHDPGITFIELFAWLTEMQIFTLNQVMDSHLYKYLELLGLNPTADVKPGDDFLAFRKEFQTPCRAVTSSDYEKLAAAHEGVARAKAVVEEENSVCIIIVPAKNKNAAVETARQRTAPPETLIRQVYEKLAPLRLLTTRVRVAGPQYVEISGSVTITLKQGFVSPLVENRVVKALKQFLSPVKEKPGDNAWPFGRPVYRSDVYKVVEAVEGVECVPALVLNGTGNHVSRENNDIKISPYRIVYPGEIRVETS